MSASEFVVGVDACVVVRTGVSCFDVFPKVGGGRHVLELLVEPVRFSPTNESYTAWLDGVQFHTDGCLGLWDLLVECEIGGSWVYNQEDI